MRDSLGRATMRAMPAEMPRSKRPESRPPGTLRLLALRAFDNATAQDMVDWAVTALAGGWDSPSLRILAGLDLGELPSVFEANPYLDRALHELGFEVPDHEVVVRDYVDQLAAEIAGGRLNPKDGVDLIHLVAVSPLSHPPDLQPWCDLSDGLDPHVRAPVDLSALDDLIRSYAHEWVRQHGIRAEARPN